MTDLAALLNFTFRDLSGEMYGRKSLKCITSLQFLIVQSSYNSRNRLGMS